MRIKKRTLKKIEERISVLVEKLNDGEMTVETREDTERQIDQLIGFRNELSKGKESKVWVAPVISGVFSMSGILLVLYFEKADIITTKAFNMATRMIKG